MNPFRLRSLIWWAALLGSTTILSGQSISKNDYHFEFLNKVTSAPVEDQASTGTCWSFSTLSFLETEAMRQGKQLVDLSEMYYVRLNYLEKGNLYLRYQGNNTFGEGSLSHDIMHLYDRYGAMPEVAYTGLIGQSTRHNHSKLVADLQKYLDDLIASRNIQSNWRDAFNEILDDYLGPLPVSFLFEGQEYDPKTFAAKFVGVNPENYVTITSFSHHNPYTSFILEIPDNYSRESYLNVTLDDLVSITDHALINGHSVVWDCDVSEKGFSARQGLAIVPSEDALATSKQAVFDAPSPELNITPELRQEEFDSYSLTDDHLMHITGSAKDQNGKIYYYVKNSWGDRVGMDGFLFASQPYFKLNTIAITLHQSPYPNQFAKKWNL
ncbi:MAG: aminopeptidase [Saprospiraceae bacterium]|nr:aminopeptidase [Saprospiraceae bacterium]